ncbi:hypothetical protein ACJJWD_11530 [Comamonas testosteroni]
MVNLQFCVQRILSRPQMPRWLLLLLLLLLLLRSGHLAGAGMIRAICD